MIPASIRRQVSISVGDVLEANVHKGRITFTPKPIVDRQIAQSLEDYKKGRFYGPFETSDELIRSLKANLKKRTKKRRPA